MPSVRSDASHAVSSFFYTPKPSEPSASSLRDGCVSCWVSDSERPPPQTFTTHSGQMSHCYLEPNHQTALYEHKTNLLSISKKSHGGCLWEKLCEEETVLNRSQIGHSFPFQVIYARKGSASRSQSGCKVLGITFNGYWTFTLYGSFKKCFQTEKFLEQPKVDLLYCIFFF